MKLILILIIAFIPFLLYSQTTTSFKVGKGYKPSVQSSLNHRVEDPNTGNLVHFDTRDVEILDANKLSPSITLKLENLPKSYSIVASYNFNDKLYFVYSTGDLKAKTLTYWGLQVDFATGKTIGEPKKIVELEGLFYGVPTITFSKETNKGLFRFRKAPANVKDGQNTDIIEICIFDDNLNQIARGSLNMPYTEKKMDNLHYFMDNDNHVYLLTKVRPDGSDKDYKREGKNAILKSHIELIQFDLKNNSSKITKLDLGEYNYYSISPSLDKNGIIRLVSFYSKSVSTFIPPANGLLVGYFNPTTGELQKKSYEIPLSILNAYETKRERAKNEDEGAGLDGLLPWIINWNDDNSLVVVGNQHFSTDGGISFCKDLLVAKINPNGELAYMNRILKRSNAGGSNLQYGHVIKDDFIYYFDFDNYQNLNLKKDDEPRDDIDEGELCFVLFKIDTKTGNCTKKSIFKFNQKTNGATLSPRNIMHVTPIKNEGILILSQEVLPSAYTVNNNRLLMKVMIKEVE